MYPLTSTLPGFSMLGWHKMSCNSKCMRIATSRLSDCRVFLGWFTVYALNGPSRSNWWVMYDCCSFTEIGISASRKYGGSKYSAKYFEKSKLLLLPTPVTRSTNFLLSRGWFQWFLWGKLIRWGKLTNLRAQDGNGGVHRILHWMPTRHLVLSKSAL